jgi:hypothetical protein
MTHSARGIPGFHGPPTHPLARRNPIDATEHRPVWQMTRRPQSTVVSSNWARRFNLLTTKRVSELSSIKTRAGRTQFTTDKMTGFRIMGELSARGLENISSGERDFAFVFDGEEVRCSRFQAQFLSPRVSSLLQHDPSIDRIEVDIDIDTRKKSAIIPFLSRLIETGQVDFPVSDTAILSDFARFLGNHELLELFVKKAASVVDKGNVLQRLAIVPTEEDVCFLASHFPSVCEQPAIQHLSFDLLSSVLTHPELRLESEDSLFRFIESLCSKAESFRDLIEFVEAQYLSDSCIEDYLSFVDPDRLSRGTWQSICRRLSLPVSPSAANRRLAFAPVNFTGDQSSMFRGILHRMSEECKGNPHLSGKVKVSANDERSDRTFQVHDLIYATDKTRKWWGTNGTAVDHYVKLEFASCRIRPSGYSLKAHSKSWGTNLLIRSWRFEGSNNDSEWVTLHTQKDSDAIAANDKCAFFPVSTPHAYRIFRMIMEEVNSSNTRQFSLQQIEIFGQIHPAPQ